MTEEGIDMSEEIGGQGTDSPHDAPKEGGGWRKRLITVGIILAIVLGQTVCAFVLIKKIVGPRLSARAKTDTSSFVRTKARPVTRTRNFYLLDGMVVNAVGRRGGQFLSVSVGLELDPATQEEVAREIREKELVLQELVTCILSAAEPTVLHDRDALRARLLEEVSKRIVRGKIVGLHFARLVMAYGQPIPGHDQMRVISGARTIPVLNVGR